MKTTVGNVRTYLGNDGMYIGRNKSLYHYGNPFTHRTGSHTAAVEVKTVSEAVQAFKDWIEGTKYQEVEPDRRFWIQQNIARLKGKTLLCFCKFKGTEPCHGDVLAELADKEL